MDITHFQGIIRIFFCIISFSWKWLKLCWEVYHVPLRFCASVCFHSWLFWAFPSRVAWLRLLGAWGIISTTGIFFFRMGQTMQFCFTSRRNEIRAPVLVFFRPILGFHTKAQRWWTVPSRAFLRAEGKTLWRCPWYAMPVSDTWNRLLGFEGSLNNSVPSLCLNTYTGPVTV